jgi:hypothetical protein
MHHSLYTANIFIICSANIFSQPNAARFPVHRIRPVTQDNIGPATPTQESTASASAPLQNVVQIASGGCTTTAPPSQDRPRALEQNAAPQDSLPAATISAPAPENEGPAAGTTTINTPQIASSECTTMAPQDLPIAPEQNAAPAATISAPAPENEGPAAGTTTINTPQMLAEKRYTRTEKMRPGHGCTVRYVS